MNLSQDEAEDISFVASAHTINLCQQCYNERLTAQGQAMLKSWHWQAVVEKKAHRGRQWKMLGNDQFIQGMWEYFSLKRLKAKKFMKEAEKEKQEGIQGQWQHESPAKEYLEQVKCCKDTGCTPRMMKQCFFALKSGELEECKGIFKVEAKATEWAFERIREAFEKVAKEEAEKLSIVQRIMLKSTDYLRRISAPAGGKEVSRYHICARTATVSPGRLRVVGFSWQEAQQLVVRDLRRKI